MKNLFESLDIMSLFEVKTKYNTLTKGTYSFLKDALLADEPLLKKVYSVFKDKSKLFAQELQKKFLNHYYTQFEKSPYKTYIDTIIKNDIDWYNIAKSTLSFVSTHIENIEKDSIKNTPEEKTPKEESPINTPDEIENEPDLDKYAFSKEESLRGKRKRMSEIATESYIFKAIWHELKQADIALKQAVSKEDKVYIQGKIDGIQSIIRTFSKTGLKANPSY